MNYSGQVIRGPDEGLDLEADLPTMKVLLVAPDGRHVEHWYDWQRVELPNDNYIEGWVIQRTIKRRV